ncbi:HEPN domain-containing protein [Mesorhizobium sp. M4A.F.Ca.ET.020.02.1.1]|uniref:HEPN domain-containing protein n=1 Tax=unclassified Mesorhizobium TaxID=325217 RepID=UPI000FCB7921|nr:MULTISPECIES: HEPN domain-containing protein [unclassified Mesorhizobium]RUX47811.1 HEPN domain-containing protein [Mesorhizobium sp. M4A.F.Ca.ET.050.02.1.1]RVD41341.1 HEPN domain-containing protein [Mesorhizobium sp. M4A.F.Ca.ET.020.02.1.1]RWC20293.1 MAG: HEPN domain-containing protein [Mesorhizobium sp.]RWD27726.1 MAG: HEPN domain-containing protein [Mesorhizobium sp.]RWD31076.1 MAG: HEPN domain-containing protein [Mesorhizobium sp.]
MSIEIAEEVNLSSPSAESDNEELNIDRFALSSFRHIADQDYISARLSHRARLFPQFLWQSQQCLEKYAKFLLLLHRVKARRIGHSLERAFALLDARLPFPIQLSDGTRRFVVYIDNIGRWRYLEGSQFVTGDELHRLDRAVWELRRYCQRRLARSPSGEATPAQRQPWLKEVADAEANRQAFRLSSGFIERILDDEKHPARSGLVWKNLCFGKRKRDRIFKVPMPVNFTNSALWLYPEIIDRVEQYVHVPKEIAAACREAISERAAQGQLTTNQT